MQVANGAQLEVREFSMFLGIAPTPERYGTEVDQDQIDHFSHNLLLLIGSGNMLKVIANVFSVQDFGGYGVGGITWCLGMLHGMSIKC